MSLSVPSFERQEYPVIGEDLREVLQETLSVLQRVRWEDSSE
jgi:hypothetical protein